MVLAPSLGLYVQCRHLITALNAWAAKAEYTTARPVANYFPKNASNDDLTIERSFDLQASRVIDVLDIIYVDHV